jgi:hypothetical protein
MSPRAVSPVRAAETQVPIFIDGFESGNLSAWSAKVLDGGDLAVTAPAALEGTKGMRALLDDNHFLHVQDNTPNNEAVYNIHFHFDPNSIVMANLDGHNIFIGYDLKTTLVPALRSVSLFPGRLPDPDRVQERRPDELDLHGGSISAMQNMKSRSSGMAPACPGITTGN